MTTLPPRTAPRDGFTLIELSIVLVIIGLIVGGVLVGQDLIRAAEIRATVGQVEKYNAAVNTFRTKYNGIPGDLIASQATAFGICASAVCTGVAGAGDGNGIIADNVAGTGTLGVGEPLLFWYELSQASLIDGSLGTGMATAAAGPVAAVALTSSNVNTYFPPAKMGRGNTWFVGNNGAGQNFYLLSGLSAMTVGGVYTFTNNTTPIEAYNIDVKLDDGAPTTGIVQARGLQAVATTFGEIGTLNGPTYSAGGATGCAMGASASDPAATYNRGTTQGSSPNCALRFRFN